MIIMFYVRFTAFVIKGINDFGMECTITLRSELFLLFLHFKIV